MEGIWRISKFSREPIDLINADIIDRCRINVPVEIKLSLRYCALFVSFYFT